MYAYRSLSVALAVFVTTLAGAAERDPIQLLRDAATAAGAPDSASFDLVVTTKLVRNETVDDIPTAFRYRTAPGGRYEFVSVDEQGEVAPQGFLTTGNGEVSLTAVLGRNRHMLEEDQDGFASFIRSPAAMGIGSGLGGMALALVSPTAINDLVANVTESEFLGEVEVGEETLLHARYLIAGGIPVEIWFTSGDQPLVRRVKPDVLATEGIQRMAQQFDKFDYQLTFDFNDWDTAAGLTAKDIRVIEPNGSLLMASLYSRPARGPHPLLGKEAPVLTLASAAGEEVNLAESIGKDVVLIEFWSTGCGYCVKAMPEIEKVEAAYAEKGVKYYAVNMGESADLVAEFLEAKGLTATALLDQEGALADAYDVGPIPLILLIGREGKVQSATVGLSPTLREDLSQKVEATLAGEDLASAKLAEWKAVEDARAAERERLRSLLDS